MIQVYDGDGVEHVVETDNRTWRMDALLLSRFLHDYARGDEVDLIDQVNAPVESLLWDTYHGIGNICTRLAERKLLPLGRIRCIREAACRWRERVVESKGW